MKKYLLIFAVILTSVQVAVSQQLNIASYNIRYDNEADAKRGDGWQKRCPVQIELIRFNNFDIVGAQEVLHNQLLDLQAALPEYGYIGVGRDDGKTKGEYASIFYNKNRIEVLKSGHFWLSEETDYPNKGWDAVLPRICTWGQFKDKKSKRKFWFFNLHMDHVGVEARRQSAKLVLEKMKNLCGTEPMILTGDFNVDQTHESYKLLANSNTLFDSYETAKIRYAQNGTFNAWSTNNFTESRIDHVFVSKKFEVERYGVLTDTYRSPVENAEAMHKGDFPKEVTVKEYISRLPSDHFPVKVILNFNKK